MMVVAHNLLAMNGDRMLGINTNKKAKSTEKLSSGYRINRSADDAAGLAMSEKMRRQIRGLTQASQNIQDGVSFCQVAEGYLNEVHDILHRINELSVKSANGTNTPEDRQYMDDEVQELKGELSRIFSDAEFNEIKIWYSPYAPDPAVIPDEPGDIQVFNTDAGGGYGGVEINDIRYTWNELGIQVSEDGRTFTGDQVTEEFDDYTGERIQLKVYKGQSTGNVTRNYNWKADDTGILINNVRAATWDEMDRDAEGQKYSFSFRNMDISFKVQEGDTREDIIRGINGDGLSGYTWDIASPGVDSSKAVMVGTLGIPAGTGATTENWKNEINEVTGIAWDGIPIDITNENKDVIDLEYKIEADEDGVTIKDSGGNAHTKMEWSEFYNRGGNYTQAGTFHISDWGLTDHDNTDVTFDDRAIYRYEDIGSVVPLSFPFTLADEASRDAVIAGLDGVVFTESYSAPGEITLSTSLTGAAGISSEPVEVKVISNDLNDNFKLQRSYGRDFNSPTAELNGVVIRTYVENETHTEGHFEYSGQFAGRAFAVSGGTFAIPANDENYEQPDEVSITTDAGTAMTLLFKNDSRNIGEMTTNIKFQATEKATRTFNASENNAGNVNNAPEFTELTLNLPKRRLDIQAGAEANQHIKMEWDIMSNGYLGIAGTNVRTAGNAGAAISQVKRALRLVSEQRSDFGAYQNRLAHAKMVDDNVVENTTAAESRIRDTDMAKEMVMFSNQSIIQQAGQAMLAQANQSNQGILSLLG